jgi:prepilin-type N-terminal cleavage/methylation domain-containing protein
MFHRKSNSLATLQPEKGFTLLEIIVGVAIFGMIILMVGKLMSPLTQYFQRNRARQQANLQMRICLETIERMMSNGRANTCILSAPPAVPTLSQAKFKSIDGFTYTIFYSTSPLNSVHLQRTKGAIGDPIYDSVLATNVSALIFGWDSRDPALINVTISLRVPLDSSGRADNSVTILMPPQIIRMVGS